MEFNSKEIFIERFFRLRPAPTDLELNSILENLFELKLNLREVCLLYSNCKRRSYKNVIHLGIEITQQSLTNGSVSLGEIKDR